MRKSLIALAAIAATYLALRSDTNISTIQLNGIQIVTNTFDAKTNFLTIKGREHIRMQQVSIVRVTDDEWKLLTNYYRDHVETTAMFFYGEVKENQ